MWSVRRWQRKHLWSSISQSSGTCWGFRCGSHGPVCGIQGSTERTWQETTPCRTERARADSFCGGLEWVIPPKISTNPVFGQVTMGLSPGMTHGCCSQSLRSQDSGSDWHRDWPMQWKRTSTEKASGNDFPPIKCKSNEEEPHSSPRWECHVMKGCVSFILEEAKKGQEKHRDSKPLH